MTTLPIAYILTFENDLVVLRDVRTSATLYTFPISIYLWGRVDFSGNLTIKMRDGKRLKLTNVFFTQQAQKSSPRTAVAMFNSSMMFIPRCNIAYCLLFKCSTDVVGRLEYEEHTKGRGPCENGNDAVVLKLSDGSCFAANGYPSSMEEFSLFVQQK